MIVHPEHFEYPISAEQEQKRAIDAADLSVTEKHSLHSSLSAEPFFSETATYCFFCGEKLTIPAVMWNGQHLIETNEPAELWLHPGCAERLSAGLSRDVDELKRANQ